MKLVLVHDWIIDLGGAEQCLRVFHNTWPEAPVYTLISNPESAVKMGFNIDQIHSSFLQRMPRAAKWHRHFLPLYPLAIEQFDLSPYDLILSSSHAAAKGVLAGSGQLHICYCHTPIRYAWDLYNQYLQEHHLQRGLKSALVRLVLHYIRMWDVAASSRVDHFIANSSYTARRIWRAYRREAEIIFPPVDVDRFAPTKNKDDFFIFVSRLVPYKRADLVVAAFTNLDLPLLVVGDGPQLERCRSLAGRNISFMGYQSDAKLAELMARARALVFAAEEDFGIVPVEAQACGTPVIAYGKGGVEDTVVPADGSNWKQATGVFFYEQTAEAIVAAVNQFIYWEKHFDMSVLRQHAELFKTEEFEKQICSFISAKWEQRQRIERGL